MTTWRFRGVWVAGAAVVALLAFVVVLQAWSVDAAPGDDDATFVPTAGCRLTDTRPAPNTVGPRSAPIGADEAVTVTVRGSNGQCTGALAIPSDAVGVALNVTAVNATAPSNVRLYPANLSSAPTLSNLNVTAGAPATPNKVDVKLSPDGKIKVYNFAGSVNIIIDVVGYYSGSSLQELADELGAVKSDLAAVESEVASLAARMPFTVSAGDRPQQAIGSSAAAVTELSVTAPADGHVTVHHSTIVTVTGSPGAVYVTCAPFVDGTLPTGRVAIDDVGVGFVSAYGHEVNNAEGNATGERVFEIAAGQTVTYIVACSRSQSSTSGWAFSPSLTATFTPAP
ncbi:hypothetical protein BDK89_0745 [Ilumatobacter fluminis]|uniref:Uncharacterized protein n=1 Tax=Ilumatobacter fluminis TaxID=467091 RepID=A0A4R7HW04_9ACTN|nr:hypothetical protein [Ilumatobacter fluminis]TDT15181.1 hypothetical protein BDK89_0745 [Ilumatobacter fluminis]